VVLPWSRTEVTSPGRAYQAVNHATLQGDEIQSLQAGAVRQKRDANAGANAGLERWSKLLEPSAR